MSNIHVDRARNKAVVEYEGRFVRSDEGFKLRNAVSNSLLVVLLAMQTGETGLVLPNGVSGDSPPPSDLLT